MLRAYIDDSASDQGDERLFMCAYVTTAEQWEKFSRDWDAALRAPPHINHLHMVDAWAFRGEFSRFSRAERDAKLVAVGSVIQKYKPITVQVSVSRKAFNEILRPVAPYFLRTPYFSCFYGVVIGVARFHKELGVTQPVDFIFDAHTAGPQTAAFYEYVKKQHPEFADVLGGKPQFQDDKDVEPLQAADMLAWHLRRESEDRLEHLPALHYLRDLVAEMDFSNDSLKDLAERFATAGGSKVAQRREWLKIKPIVFAQLAAGTWPTLDKRPSLLQRLRNWLTPSRR